MAKALPISGLKPTAPVRGSLARLFGVRIGELWNWERYLADPDRVRELHDMRIAAKRLRYLFEFFTPYFTPDLEALLVQFKQLQDYLGEIHDCDVWIGYLRRQLDDAFTELNAERRSLGRFSGAQPGLKVAVSELAGLLSSGPAQGLAAFIAEVVDRRCQLHDELLAFWNSLQVADFRGQLLAAVAAAGGADAPEVRP